MPRKKAKKQRGQTGSRVDPPGPLTDNPFNVLKGVRIEEEPPAPPPEEALEPAKKEPESDQDVFAAAMEGVERVSWKSQRVTARASEKKSRGSAPVYSEDLEVLTHLTDLVAGRTHFDIVDTDEYLEGFMHGTHPMIVRKLRRGMFSVQAYLDLHGLTVREATEAVRDFIQEAVGLGYRCVLLVHGRGLNSKDQIPVLKQKLNTILLSGPTRKHILAFTTARPVDGGAGASYVLLRASKGRKSKPLSVSGRKRGS